MAGGPREAIAGGGGGALIWIWSPWSMVGVLRRGTSTCDVVDGGGQRKLCASAPAVAISVGVSFLLGHRFVPSLTFRHSG